MILISAGLLLPLLLGAACAGHGRPDLAQISGTAQLVSHLAFHALRASEMRPARSSAGCPLAPRMLYKDSVGEASSLIFHDQNRSSD
eukprot:COSAG01_NODE_246_length_20450_cov_195.166822_9_plen_87_part_00